MNHFEPQTTNQSATVPRPHEPSPGTQNISLARLLAITDDSNPSLRVMLEETPLDETLVNDLRVLAKVNCVQIKEVTPKDNELLLPVRHYTLKLLNPDNNKIESYAGDLTVRDSMSPNEIANMFRDAIQNPQFLSRADYLSLPGVTLTEGKKMAEEREPFADEEVTRPQGTIQRATDTAKRFPLAVISNFQSLDTQYRIAMLADALMELIDQRRLDGNLSKSYAHILVSMFKEKLDPVEIGAVGFYILHDYPDAKGLAAAEPFLNYAAEFGRSSNGVFKKESPSHVDF